MRIQLLLLALLTSTALAQSGDLTVHVDQPSHKISPTLYGLMTEEINHSYDGGLYAELIQNRIFKDSASSPLHWSAVKSDGSTGEIALDTTDPVNTNALTTSLKLTITTVAAGGRVGVANDGFWGIPVQRDTTYHASFYAQSRGGFTGPLTVDIESASDGTILASAVIPQIDTQWKQYQATLTTGDIKSSSTNRFVISAASAGAIDFNLVSLFPPTYNNRANGNRVDLMQMLADMHPAFLRLPGGNYLEGNTIPERFEWKDTIGPLENRPGHQGPWRYRSSDGLGLLEFLEWCQDLQIEPILAVYAGYSLRGQRVVGKDLQPYVQDALDEIEYVTGDTTTKWGKVRADDGHPDPFALRFVEVGNEDNLDRSGSYAQRFPPFFDAIRAKYPDLKIIATAVVRNRTPDFVDDHYYRTARAMERDVHHYDMYPRNGTKIFVGEWASTEGRPTPTLNAAIGDAAWLTGLERNSDVVQIASYAPLLVNVNPNASQWGTNLIGYNASSSFGSPSYYAQKMFAENRGDTVLPVDLSVQNGPPDQTPPHGGIGLATWQTSAEFKNIKVTNGDQTLYQSDFSQDASGWRGNRGSRWSVVDGAYRQTVTNRQDCRATTGDSDWTDYTYSLQARKLEGGEGMLVMFHVQGPDDFVWWNLGGWGNSRSALEASHDGERTEFGQSADVTIETGRWYDVRIEVKGRDIKCYLDDKLITEATDAPVPPRSYVFAEASRVDANGQVILKIVNAMDAAQNLAIHLNGVTSVSPNATVVVLTGKPSDQNTIADPLKVSPHEEQITDAAVSFTHTFAPYSVNVVKLDCR